MRKIQIIFIVAASIIFSYCQKELSDTQKEPETQIEKNEKKALGIWKFVSFTDSNRVTFTSANPCYADDTFELRENGTGVISQGTCIQYPDKPRDLGFSWHFISEDVVDFGTDTVKLVIFTDRELRFRRISPSYLEYHWKR
jgi:hypothetical protein